MAWLAEDFEVVHMMLARRLSMSAVGRHNVVHFDVFAFEQFVAVSAPIPGVMFQHPFFGLGVPVVASPFPSVCLAAVRFLFAPQFFAAPDAVALPPLFAQTASRQLFTSQTNCALGRST